MLLFSNVNDHTPFSFSLTQYSLRHGLGNVANLLPFWCNFWIGPHYWLIHLLPCHAFTISFLYLWTSVTHLLGTNTVPVSMLNAIHSVSLVNFLCLGMNNLKYPLFSVQLYLISIQLKTCPVSCRSISLYYIKEFKLNIYYIKEEEELLNWDPSRSRMWNEDLHLCPKDLLSSALKWWEAYFLFQPHRFTP